ncbi:MoxR family ATPase [Streptomyces sp. NPDC048057]|uniref:AAA family ATPase n=1 Tax=Streptomyces sp. NPDC048057 TaxID=3155628 RepID=UPI0033ED96FB
MIDRHGRSTDEVLTGFRDRFDLAADALGHVLRGKDAVVRHALVCLLAEGHLLIEDVPGVGKTSLARALAAVFGVSSGRVQFTPDLMPSDITGVQVHRGGGAFVFVPGPVFAHVVVCDEINRASPKAQAALLEVMEERQVSVAGETHRVPTPFMVVATQNPVDFAGTYPLPEAQVDRFLMRVGIGPPDVATESEILAREHQEPLGAASVTGVLDEDTLVEMIAAARRVTVAPELHRYIALLLRETRSPEHRDTLRLGASTRAGLQLLRAARVHALALGRYGVIPDDVKDLAMPVLAHRLLLTDRAVMSGVSGAEVLRKILKTVPVPR